MRRLTTTLALLAAILLAAPGPAAAQGRFRVGLRGGYGWATGDYVVGHSMDELVSSEIPVTLELGYQLWDHLTLGAYGQYVFGTVASAQASDCATVASECSIVGYRTGLQVLVDLWPTGTVDPWLGVGIGYEWLAYEQDYGYAISKLTFRGWNWIVLQAGADVRVTPWLAVGPYVSYGTGVFSTEVEDIPPAGTNEITFADTSEHGWLEAGVRAIFSF
jgi:outer membrane protein W